MDDFIVKFIGTNGSLERQHVEGFVSSLLFQQAQPPSQFSINSLWPWILFFFLALVQFIFNWIGKKCIFEPFAECFFGQLQNNAPAKFFRKRKDKKEKFAQSLVEAVFYSTYFIMGCVIILEAKWVWPSTEWWVAQDKQGKLILPLNIDETTFYVAYAARYFAFFICVFLEPIRKDWWEMQVHHVTTVTLIYLSFISGFVRVGFIVMVLLDFADTFLHVAKAFKYVQECRTLAGSKSWTSTASLCADIWFALFALAFTITRIGMYGYVTWSVWYEATENWVQHEKYGLVKSMDILTAAQHGAMTLQTGFICQLLITILFILICLWEYYLMNAVWKVLSGAPLKDVRSDSENDITKED